MTECLHFNNNIESDDGKNSFIPSINATTWFTGNVERTRFMVLIENICIDTEGDFFLSLSLTSPYKAPIKIFFSTNISLSSTTVPLPIANNFTAQGKYILFISFCLLFSEKRGDFPCIIVVTVHIFLL